jgi:hypothetical protein
MRLHVWAPQSVRLQDDAFKIHDHVFEVRSHIICGSITHIPYDVTPSPEGNYEVYRVTYEDSVSTMSAAGNLVDVQLLSPVTYKTGEGYIFPAHRFHTTAVSPDLLCATLVRPVRQEPGYPRVLGPPRGRDRAFGRESLVPAESASLLEAVAAELRIV